MVHFDIIPYILYLSYASYWIVCIFLLVFYKTNSYQFMMTRLHFLLLIFDDDLAQVCPPVHRPFVRPPVRLQALIVFTTSTSRSDIVTSIPNWHLNVVRFYSGSQIILIVTMQHPKFKPQLWPWYVSRSTSFINIHFAITCSSRDIIYWYTFK